MAKKPEKKTPPVKKENPTPVFEPQYVVLYSNENPVEKVELLTQDESDKFLGLRENEYEDEIQFFTKDEFDKIEIVEPGSVETTLVLDETPEVNFDETNLPPQLVVENKKSGQQFKVSRKYFLANRGELNLI